MKEISGIYTTDRGSVKRYSIQVPGSWDELKPKQFGTAIYLLLVTTQADPGWIRLSLLTLLLENHWPVLSGLSNQDRETLLNGMYDETGECIFEALPDFFYNTEPPLINHFPKLKTKAGDLIPAAVDLSNICFGEWCFLDTYFSFYFRSHGDETWLNLMISTVYRKADAMANANSPDFSGDLRYEFNENLVKLHSENIKALPKDTKMAIFQWLAIALKQAKLNRPNIFPQAPPRIDQNGNPLSIEDSESGASWMDIYSDLIGPKFGTSDQLKKTNAFFVLDYLNKQEKMSAATTS
jgi:hypothetical protein